MGVANVKISGKVGSGIERLSYGYAGAAHRQYPEMRQPTGIDLSGLTLPVGAKTDTVW